MIDINMLYILIFLAWIMLLIGFKYKDYPIGAISAIFLMILGIYIMIYSLDGVQDWFTNGIATIHICVGGYVLIRGTWENYKNF